MSDEFVTNGQVKEVVQEAVRETLVALGLNIDDPIELQKDMAHLREWRESTQEIKKKGIMVIVGVVVSGTLAALWVGFRSLVHIN